MLFKVEGDEHFSLNRDEEINHATFHAADIIMPNLFRNSAFGTYKDKVS